MGNQNNQSNYDKLPAGYQLKDGYQTLNIPGKPQQRSQNGKINRKRYSKQTSKPKPKPWTTEDQRNYILKKYGMSEEDARAKQQILADNGFLTQDQVDGYWGDKSKAAWAKWQNKKELERLEAVQQSQQEIRQEANNWGYIEIALSYV